MAAAKDNPYFEMGRGTFIGNGNHRITKGNYGNGSGTRRNDDGEVELQGRPKGKRVEQLQAEVDEVAGILHTTVDKLLERGEKLDDLMDNADNLRAQASSFHTTAHKVKVHYKWKNRTYILIGVVIALAILAVIAVIVVCILRPWEAT